MKIENERERRRKRKMKESRCQLSSSIFCQSWMQMKIIDVKFDILAHYLLSLHVAADD
jgi:hypothetical protein